MSSTILPTIGTEISVDFVLVRHRPADDEALQLDFDGSNFDGCLMAQYELSETPLPEMGSQVERAGRVHVSLTTRSKPARFVRTGKVWFLESELPPVSFSVAGIVEH